MTSDTSVGERCGAVIERAMGNDPSAQVRCFLPIRRRTEGGCLHVPDGREHFGTCGHGPEYHYAADTSNPSCDGCANDGRGGNFDSYDPGWEHYDPEGDCAGRFGGCGEMKAKHEEHAKEHGYDLLYCPRAAGVYLGPAIETTHEATPVEVEHG